MFTDYICYLQKITNLPMFVPFNKHTIVIDVTIIAAGATPSTSSPSQPDKYQHMPDE